MKPFTAVPAALLLCAPAILAPAVFAQSAPVTPPATTPAVTAPAVTAPAVTAPAGAPVMLALNLKPGDVIPYKVDVNMNGTMGLPGSGQTAPLTATMTSFAKLYVDSQNPDGSWAVRYKVGGIKSTMNGMPMASSDSGKGYETKGTLGKDGVFKSADAPAASPGMSMGMSPSQLVNGVFSTLMSLPPTPVNVGDTWSTTSPVPFDTTGTNTITITNKVLGFDTIKSGERVARIEKTLSGPLNMSMTQPVHVTITGDMNSTGTERLAVATGLPLDMVTTSHLKLTATAPNHAGNGDTQTMAINMDVKTNVGPATVPPAPTPAQPITPKKQAPKGK